MKTTALIGVIGAGHYAVRSHIPALLRRSEVRLKSVCREGQAELDHVAERFAFEHSSTDWRAVLALPLDGIIVATPNDLHYEIAHHAIARGMHVLIEKPMCLRPDHAWQLVADAKTMETQLIVANGWHYRPGIEQALTLVRKIGPVEFMTCHMSSSTRSVFAGSGNKQQFAGETIQPEAGTWQDMARGGGFAWGQLSHLLALVFWISGLRPDAVRAIASGTRDGVDLHDAALFEFEGGAVGTVSGTCALPEPHRSELDMRLYGPFGSFSIDLDREHMRLRLHDGTDIRPEIEPGSWLYDCAGPVNALVDACLGKDSNRSSGATGARTVSAIDALVRSASTGGVRVSTFQP